MSPVNTVVLLVYTIRRGPQGPRTRVFTVRSLGFGPGPTPVTLGECSSSGDRRSNRRESRGAPDLVTVDIESVSSPCYLQKLNFIID